MLISWKDQEEEPSNGIMAKALSLNLINLFTLTWINSTSNYIHFTIHYIIVSTMVQQMVVRS